MAVHPRDRTEAEPQIPSGAASKGPLRSAGTPAKTATMTVVVGFFALFACLFVLGTVAEGVRTQEVTEGRPRGLDRRVCPLDLFTLDTEVTPFLHALASPALDTAMQAATFIGSNFVIPPVFVIAVLLLVRSNRRREALFLVIASVGGFLLNTSMKLFFQRARPPLAWANVLPDYSFPSGHTMNSLCFYVALAIVAWSIFGRRAGLPAVVGAVALAMVIGVSRIYLGYHYFTDVFGGLLAGAGWLLVVGAAFRTGPLYGLWRDVGPPGSDQSGSVPSEAKR